MIKWKLFFEIKFEYDVKSWEWSLKSQIIDPEIDGDEILS